MTCAQIVTLITDSSKPQGSMTGQEERDVHFARLFGLMSVIQSHLIVRVGSLRISASSSAGISTLSNYTDILSQLIALGEKKSWLRESAWFVILLGIDVLHEAEVDWRLDAIKATIREIFVEYKVWSPEKIAVALKMQSLYPDQNWTKIFSPTFKDGDLLSSTNLQTLTRTLKVGFLRLVARFCMLTAAQGFSHGGRRGIHQSWRRILETAIAFRVAVFIGSIPTWAKYPSCIKGFFPRLLSYCCRWWGCSSCTLKSLKLILLSIESLFSATSSPQRKYWGFQMFQKALNRIDEEHMPMLFTRNLMRSWINHLSNRDGYLHKMAQQTVRYNFYSTASAHSHLPGY